MENVSSGLGRRAFLSSGVAALAAVKVARGGDADAGPARTVDPAKTAGEFDVCVVGGSCTGVFAAVRAAAAVMDMPGRYALAPDSLFRPAEEKEGSHAGL